MKMTITPTRSNRETSQASTTFGVTVILIVAACIPFMRRLEQLFEGRFGLLVLAALVGALLLGRVKRPTYVGVWATAFAAIPVAGLIAGANSSITASVTSAVQIALVVALSPFVLCYYTAARPKLVGAAAASFIGAQTISAGAGLLQLTGAQVLGTAANEGRSSGLAGHPNVLGIMCVVAILLCLAAVSRSSRKVRVASSAAAVINAGALLATGSLSALLALTVGLICALIALRITRKTLITILALAAILVPIATFAGVDITGLTSGVETRIDVVTGEAEGVASLDIREETYRYAWDSIVQDPFVGVGMDGANQGTFNGVTVVHNYILRAWYQGGIVYLLVIATISIALLAMTLSSLRHARNAAPASIIAAVITYAMTSAFYEQQQYWLLVTFSVAVISVTGERESQRIGALPTF